MDVESDLLEGVDCGIGRGTRRAVKFVDIGAALVRQETAFVSGTVEKDQDIFGHLILLSSPLPDLMRAGTASSKHEA